MYQLNNWHVELLKGNKIHCLWNNEEKIFYHKDGKFFQQTLVNNKDKVIDWGTAEVNRQEALYIIAYHELSNICQITVEA